MEPLAAQSTEEARAEAVAVMRQHSSAISVHIFVGDVRVDSILAEDLAADLSRAEARQKDAICR